MHAYPSHGRSGADVRRGPAGRGTVVRSALQFLALSFRHPSLRSKPWPPHGPDHYQANLAHGWRFYYRRVGDEAVIYWMEKHPKKGG